MGWKKKKMMKIVGYSLTMKQRTKTFSFNMSMKNSKLSCINQNRNQRKKD